MKMLKSYYQKKNLLRTSRLVKASKSCYVIKRFALNNISVDKNINLKQALFFSLLKKRSLKSNKIVNIVI